jgi:hypothetical protein
MNGANIPIPSRCSVVLVDKMAQEVPAPELHQYGAGANGVGCVRGFEVESPIGPAAVVVAGVGPQDSLEVPMADKRPVQALGSN